VYTNQPHQFCLKCGKPLPADIISLILDKKNPKRLEIKKIIATTAPSIEGYRVVKTLDIVSAECVLGINFFHDLFASLSDFAGGRSKTYQKNLRAAKDTCLYELREEADKVGGNAAIAVDLDYSEVSGGGKSMLFLVANGTAVRIEKSE
jgi:uncharacterized protein YbjQ (UPF0145 family)